MKLIPFISGKTFISSVLLFYISSISAKSQISLQIIPTDSIGISILKNEKLSFTLKDSAEAIRKLKVFSEYWFSKNYLSIGYDSIHYKKDKIQAFLFLGNQITFDSIIIDQIPEKFLKANKLRTVDGNNYSFNYQEFKTFNQNTLSYFENHGYPFSQIQLSDIQIHKSNIKAHLLVNKNNLVTFDSIIVKGNPNVSKKYLHHLIRINRGKTFDQSKIDGIPVEIEALPYLKLVKPPEIEFRQGKADIYLYLKNNSANQFSGVIGFGTDSISNSGIQLNGEINLILQNSFKIGDRIEFYWSRFSKATQNLKIGLKFPYLFILPVGIQSRVLFEKYQDAYLNLGFQNQLNYRISSNSFIKIIFENKKSFVLNDSTTENTAIRGFKSSVAGLAFEINSTENQFIPLSGIYFEAKSAYGRTVNEGESGNSLLNLELDLAWFIKIRPLFYLSIKNKTASLISNSTRYENQVFKIGGINHLRGFDENSIFAKSYSIFTIEPTLIPDKKSAFFLFFDFAWVRSITQIIVADEFPYSFGTGMQIDTRAGIFRIIYGIGKQPYSPIKFSNSKIHFGFVARF